MELLSIAGYVDHFALVLIYFSILLKIGRLALFISQYRIKIFFYLFIFYRNRLFAISNCFFNISMQQRAQFTIKQIGACKYIAADYFITANSNKPNNCAIGVFEFIIEIPEIFILLQREFFILPAATIGQGR